MKVNFKELENYLFKYGYPYNELMKQDYFEIPEKTSYEYLMDNIKLFADYNAMTFYGKKIKYYEFAEYIEQTANALKGIGLEDASRIAILLPNIPETAYVQYGASKIGAIPSNIDPRVNAKTLLSYVKKENIKSIIIVDVMYESAIRPIEHELKEQYNICEIIVVSATNSLSKLLKNIMLLKSRNNRITSDVLDIVYWDEMICNTKLQHAENIGFTPNKIAVIQHSSGTSKGVPKSIPLTNENINMFVEKHRPTLFGELPHGTKMLHILPYFASYGAINSAHLGFNFGLTMQEIPEFNFSDLGWIAVKQKSEILIGVPNWFNLISTDSRIKKNSLKHVKMVISGGDSFDIKSKKNVDDFLLSHGAKCIVTNGHGMSELSGSACYTFPSHENVLGVGIPFPYDKYIIIDNDGNIVPLNDKGAKGCVWIYSPSATEGIFDGEQFIETKIINGFRFINSRDTMLISSNYEIEFIEREDRSFARYDGHKIIPYEIENCIMKNEFIKQCMVVSYEDDDKKGKMPIAYIVPINNVIEKDNIVSSIINTLCESEIITDRDIPRKVCFLSEIPQNASSKNDYAKLSNRILDGTEYTIDIQETNFKSKKLKIISPMMK